MTADVLAAFGDGVLWVSLGPDADAGTGAGLCGGKRLAMTLSSLPDLETRAAQLRALLVDKRCLLVIDDAWTVEQVKALNVGGMNCAADYYGPRRAEEITYAIKTRRQHLDRMSEDEALAMLTEWAGMIAQTYLPSVREVAKRLSYIPLSLSLAGAQARRGLAVVAVA